MAVYVDNPRKYKKRGKRWCHLFTDGSLDELHAFAKALGLKRSWYDGKKWPHYDITEEQSVFALKSGALHAGRIRMLQIAKPDAYEKITGRKVNQSNKKELTPESEESTVAQSTA